MTDLETLVGQRFWMPWAIYEVRCIRYVGHWSEAKVECAAVNWDTGKPTDETTFYRAREVVDAIRVQNEPEPRYRIGYGDSIFQARIRALVTRRDCCGCGDLSPTQDGYCPACGTPRKDSDPE